MKALRDWNVEEASHYLKVEVKEISHAGAGNMNCTMRVKTEKKSFILKQSSPFCEKFPSIAAPENRIDFEAKFYKLGFKNLELKKHLPQIVNFDQENSILVMEDLGETSDYSEYYSNSESLSLDEVKEFGSILSLIHSIPYDSQVALQNTGMRQLNHQHIFEIPFQKENGLNLDEICDGLEKLKTSIVDDHLVLRAQKLGEDYLSDGKTLLQGDYYLGSLISANDKRFVIDHEFCFWGKKEFDLGVMFAHLLLSGHKDKHCQVFLSEYEGDYDRNLLQQFAGVEILRRIFGYARLPISNEINSLRGICEKARELLLH